MGFLALVNAYTMRTTLSVAITVMVVQKKKNATLAPDSCHESDFLGADDIDTYGYDHGANRFDWSEKLQGTILSAFYWGYTLTHLPGGLLAEKFGGKYTLGLGILSTALFTLATPLAVDYGGATALIVLRALMGAGEGTTFPALSVLLASWVPLSERGKIGCFVFGGGQMGTIIGNGISGLLLAYFPGHASVFYFFGAMGIVWWIVFQFTCYSDPATHPCISEKELAYLQAELGQLKRDENLPGTPWGAIVRSAPMYVLIAAQIGHDWGFYVMSSDLPKYMSSVLLYSVSSNGLLTALPALVMWIISIATGFLGDWLIAHKKMSITASRKMWTALAAVFPAIFIVLASYVGCNRVAAVSMFTLTMGFMGMFYPGMKLTPLDMSPNYAGTLMAITNGIGSLVAGIGVPIVIGWMIPNVSGTKCDTLL